LSDVHVGRRAAAISRFEKTASTPSRDVIFRSSLFRVVAHTLNSGVRHPLLDRRHSAFRQDYQMLCTSFPMLRDLPIGHAVIPTSLGCRVGTVSGMSDAVRRVRNSGRIHEHVMKRCALEY
jgi:hypothetical protein